MHHLNEDLRRVRGDSLLDLTLPQMYHMSSIKDFLDNKPSVKPTRSISPFCIFDLNGKREIIPNFNVLALQGNAIVYMRNVNYRITEEGVNQLYDNTGSIDVALRWTWKLGLFDLATIEAIPSPVPQGHSYLVALLYSPPKDRTILWYVKPKGPPSPEMKEPNKRFTLERLLPQLQPN